MRSEQRQAEAAALRIFELECELQRQANLLSAQADHLYRALRERDEARRQLFGLLTKEAR